VTCATCRARLPEHCDTAILAVSRHLHECPACRAEYAALSCALALLEDDPCPPAPGLQTGLWARIEAAQARPAVAAWERPLALAMAALLCGWVGQWLLHGWPLAAQWFAALNGWPSPGELAAVAGGQLGAALGHLQSGALPSLSRFGGLRLPGPPASPAPAAAWLALVAAAGWLAVEWSARREAARLACETDGVR